MLTLVLTTWPKICGLKSNEEMSSVSARLEIRQVIGGPFVAMEGDRLAISESGPGFRVLEFWSQAARMSITWVERLFGSLCLQDRAIKTGSKLNGLNVSRVGLNRGPH